MSDLFWLLLGFKILIWEPRNELQIRKEKKHNISNKDKIKKSSGIKSYIENAEALHSREA
ncbi:19630_t:CDS:2 [Rhizophagus irregularis]|nr:19630_t:CDS:2 [Rhizophagus irregularis]